MYLFIALAIWERATGWQTSMLDGDLNTLSCVSRRTKEQINQSTYTVADILDGAFLDCWMVECTVRIARDAASFLRSFGKWFLTPSFNTFLGAESDGEEWGVRVDCFTVFMPPGVSKKNTGISGSIRCTTDLKSDLCRRMHRVGQSTLQLYAFVINKTARVTWSSEHH